MVHFFDWEKKTIWFEIEVPDSPICPITRYLRFSFVSDHKFFFDCVVEGNYDFYLNHYIETEAPEMFLIVKAGEKELYYDVYPQKKMKKNCFEYVNLFLREEDQLIYEEDKAEDEDPLGYS